MLRKILVVDDDAISRKVLHKMLDEEYEILEAVNGAEALEILNKKYKFISAVLLDLIMPVLDGFDVLIKMRDNIALSQIPVIVVTGTAEEDAEVKAIALGANDFVTKPYNPLLLRHCLRNTINLRETASIINAMQRDKLTGLYNREAFFDKAANMLKEQEPGFFIMSCFDIDNFKIINDRYGAAEGDRILQHIGRVARRGFAAVGGISGRISADNFAALYRAGQNEINFVTKLREGGLKPVNTHAVLVFSVGRYVITDLTLPVSAIYDRAYIAKQSVKGRYDAHVAYFDESMMNRLINEQEIISDMDTALENRQFEVWFQPQFNHTTGALIGAEALIRWRHPQKGLIYPGQFIPVFEQNGFIYELDKFVWEQACILLRQWLDEGRSPLPISVNISRYDIFRVDLLEVLTGLISKYAIPVALLRLEITESAFADSVQQIIDVVRCLIDYGFILEIDDFGSGYSSLNTLKDVPAAVLKLDMRFLENNNNSQRGGNILESVVRMAKWLDMSVIAEGVETIEQADFLKSIGCSYVQGYLYARPMPVGDYEKLAVQADKEERLLALETVANLDNNVFWDPQSMETLIFNSFIGGACIYEYYQGKIEMLRANDKYAQVIDSVGMTVEEALKLDWTEHLDMPNRQLVMAALQRSIATGDEVTEEIMFSNLPGCAREIYLRSSMRVIASAGERYLVYCTNENITEQREAEERERRASEQLRFLNETANALLTQPDTEKGIEDILWKLLEYFAGNRAYIFEFDYERHVSSNTYEVCAAGTHSERDNLQNVELSLMAFWLRAFDRQNYIRIEDVDALEAGRIEKQVLKNQDIKSLVAVGLRREGQLIGFIGIDDPGRHQDRIDRLDAIGYYIAVMLLRRDLDVKIRQITAEELSYSTMLPVALSAVMHYSEDVAYVKDKQGCYVCCSQAFINLAGAASEQEVIGKNDYELVDKILADKYRAVDQQIMASGQAQLNYDELLPSEDGSMHFINTSKYPLLDAAGKVIGIYGITRDVTEYKKAFEQLKLLTDNIPGGLASFEINSDDLRLVYCNEGFYSFSGYSKEEYRLLAAEDPLFLIFKEDLPQVHEAIKAVKNGARQITNCTYRCHTKAGGYCWVSMNGLVSGMHIDVMVVNAVQFDITERKEAEERLRVSEEEYRLAMQHSGNTIGRYNVTDRSLIMAPEVAAGFSLPDKITDVPYGTVAGGLIAQESIDAYVNFYESILQGGRTGTATFKRKLAAGWRWLMATYSTIFSDAGQPVSAVISFADVTEQREKEAVYRKWQQSLQDRKPDSYTLFRCNLSKNASFESMEGALLQVDFSAGELSFSDRTMEYVSQCVVPDDRAKYLAALNSDTLLANYYRGKRQETLEYREQLSQGEVRWLRLVIELVEYPNSSDVEAYLMYENIDASKRAELQTRVLAETDPLTGMLNRNAFAARMNQLLAARNNKKLCALLLFDLDGFKLVNDNFGHAAGDQVLIDTARDLSASLQDGDLLGRLGGDEFLIGLSAANTALIGQRAQHICSLVHKSLSSEVRVSASLGIAVCPQDGHSFEELYHKADTALYHVKAAGKDNFAFYSDNMSGANPCPDESASETAADKSGGDTAVGLKKEEG